MGYGLGLPTSVGPGAEIQGRRIPGGSLGDQSICQVDNHAGRHAAYWSQNVLLKDVPGGVQGSHNYAPPCNDTGTTTVIPHPKGLDIFTTPAVNKLAIHHADPILKSGSIVQLKLGNTFVSVDESAPCEWQWDRAYDVRPGKDGYNGWKPQLPRDVTKVEFQKTVPTWHAQTEVKVKLADDKNYFGNCGAQSWCSDGICADRGIGGFAVTQSTVGTSFILRQYDGQQYVPDGTVVAWDRTDLPLRFAYIPSYMTRARSASHQDGHMYMLQASGSFNDKTVMSRQQSTPILADLTRVTVTNGSPVDARYDYTWRGLFGKTHVGKPARPWPSIYNTKIPNSNDCDGLLGGTTYIMNNCGTTDCSAATNPCAKKPDDSYDVIVSQVVDGGKADWFVEGKVTTVAGV